MKFGVREICDVVLRAKACTKIGNKEFQKDEPVMYFDTAKTSTLEGAATTVYAQGGKGNARLIAWEGERTVTFTMEDALISPLGFSILSGAGLIEAGVDGGKVQYHMATQVVADATVDALVADLSKEVAEGQTILGSGEFAVYGFLLGADGSIEQKLSTPVVDAVARTVSFTLPEGMVDGESVRVLVDYYVEHTASAMQLEITPDKFAGSYYLEAATLFRRQSDGQDMPAQFIIPNVKIQSAFTFSLAATGDPSTFTFTMDAFPDYIKGGDKKVLFALQIIDSVSAGGCGDSLASY